MKRLDSYLPWLRFRHFILLVSIPMLAFAGEYLRASKPRDVNLIQIVLFAVGAGNVGIAFGFRRTLGRSEKEIRLRPESELAFNKWKVANLLPLVLAESIAVFGVFLMLLGGSLANAAPFYGIAFLLLIMWTPRRPR